MRDAVRRIYHERRAITASLKDVGSAVAKLDAVMLAVMLMIFIFICLLIFNKKNTLESLVPMATIVLGFSFIFGHSAQTLFESVSDWRLRYYVWVLIEDIAYLYLLDASVRCRRPSVHRRYMDVCHGVWDDIDAFRHSVQPSDDCAQCRVGFWKTHLQCTSFSCTVGCDQSADRIRYTGEGNRPVA